MVVVAIGGGGDLSGDLSTIAIISMDQSYNQTLSIWNDLMLL